MKKSILILAFLTLLTSSCSFILKNEIDGNWLAVHIFIKGEEILNNNFEEIGWFPKYHKTKPFYIITAYKAVNLPLGRHGKNQILAKFNFEKNKEGEEILKNIILRIKF